ncbi:deoxynucleoside triphosphate triphosphohydrolase SAMHD1-like [Penaeus indicus]|uniref:deoxynucleoside triphosphate triphosphohydrolase SAMHD1-like n=1 Tax=Penaeus indicus TaxID=29960 RepID=UPI00300C2CBB
MGGRKIIKDAIHGHIKLPALCVRIIDTPQFQRLRFLKQLGTTSFVYPAASHNRFEHCLGTCYLAGKMVNALRSRQEELGITEADVLCVQIAGLCHDLGHGAFSHVFETFMKESGKKESGKRFKHEEMSCKMFDHLLSENIMQDFRRAGLDEKDVRFIKDLIVGAKPSVEENGRTASKAFLFEIVNNKRTGARRGQVGLLPQGLPRPRHQRDLRVREAGSLLQGGRGRGRVADRLQGVGGGEPVRDEPRQDDAAQEGLPAPRRQDHRPNVSWN